MQKKNGFLHGKFVKLGDVAEKEIDCFSRKIREIGAQKNERNILFSRKIREIERCKKKNGYIYPRKIREIG